MNRRLLPLLAALLALAGCSDRAAAPLAPEVPPRASLLGGVTEIVTEGVGGITHVVGGVTQVAGDVVASVASTIDPAIDLDGVLEFASLPNLNGKRSASKHIRASQGGYVEVDGFRVDIPAGALPQDTTITIVLPADPVLGKRVIAEFLPHGIQFNTPVTLSFPLQGVTLPGGALDVGRWENDAWTSLGGTVSADGKRLFSTTPHFSTYAARGGAYMMGGG